MSSFNDFTDNSTDIRRNQKTSLKSSPIAGSDDNYNTENGKQLDSVISQPSLQTTSSALMPVSELQELCAKSGLRNPEYRLVRTEGNSHSPLFTIKCFLNDVEIGEGMAKSKKAAKHSAAQKALIAMKENKIPKAFDPSIDLNKLRINDSDHCDSNSSTADSTVVSGSDTHSSDTNGSAFKEQRNAVSILQELCARNCINLPTYTLSDQLGSCHEPVFHFSCEVVIGGEHIIGKSSGKTKQSAKRASAEDALRLIQQKEIPLYTTNSIRKKTRNITTNNNSNYEQLKAYKETLDLMESLQMRPDLDHLLDATGTDIDYCYRFNLIAEKLNCCSNYIPFADESSPKNKYKCLLQMRRNQSQSLSKRLPVFVSWGNSSVSEGHAMQMAAQKAIIMVKVLKM